MEKIKDSERGNGSSFANGISLLFMGLLVSAMVLMRIFERWHGFDATGKMAAVALIASLVVPPVRAIRGENSEASRFDRAQIAMWGYMSLMLATILFAR